MKIHFIRHGETSKAISCYFNGIPKDGIIEKYKHDNCEMHEFELK